jgi:hypothetical protein
VLLEPPGAPSHHDESCRHSGDADRLERVRIVETPVDVAVDAEADGVHRRNASQRGGDPAIQTPDLGVDVMITDFAFWTDFRRFSKNMYLAVLLVEFDFLIFTRIISANLIEKNYNGTKNSIKGFVRLLLEKF